MPKMTYAEYKRLDSLANLADYLKWYREHKAPQLASKPEPTQSTKKV